MDINILRLSFGRSHEHVSINVCQSGMKSYWSKSLCLFSRRIDIFKYVIYGIAAAFFVYGILLMVEGFFTTGAIKDLYGDFKITTCGRCVSAWVCYLSMFRVGCGFISIAHRCSYSSAKNWSIFFYHSSIPPVMAI